MEDAKDALTTYWALLEYTGIRHEDLEYFLPSSDRSSPGPSFITLPAPLTTRDILSILLTLPPLPIYTPGFLLGYLAGEYLVREGEDEAVAQVRGVLGGVGVGLGVMGGMSLISRFGLGLGRAPVVSRAFGWASDTLGLGTARFKPKSDWLLRYLSQAFGAPLTKRVLGVLGTLGTFYLTAWVVVRWYGKGRRRNWRR